MMIWRGKLRPVLPFLPPVIAVAVGFAAALILVTILGESPANVVSVLTNGAFGSPTSLGYSLFYATPLILTGLSVWWALQAGLFNIGAEGQMTIGGVAMVSTGILLPDLPSAVAIPFSLLMGFLAGAFWGAIVAWFKIKRGAHEVLTSILLNFVSYGVSGFFVLNLFRNHEVQTPETLPVGSGFQLPELSWIGGTSPVNGALILALIVVLIADRAMQRSVFGLRTRWAGGAPEFARRSGVAIDRQMVLSFFVAGGLAGLAGASTLLGYAHKAREGFAGGAGFIGIAVALLGGKRAFGVLVAALLFGALQKGALDLDLDTEKVSRDLAVVIQALIVMAVAARAWFGAKRWSQT